MEKVFFANQLRMYYGNVAQVKLLADMIPSFAGAELSEAETSELGQATTALARRMTQFRRYGVKPIAFPFEDVRPNTDLVFHEFQSLNRSVQGSQPVGLAVLVQADLEPASKVQLQSYETSRGDNDVIVLENLLNGFLVDSYGELFAGGISPDLESIPVRDLFEREGARAQYEYLRAMIVSRLFDTIAPAAVVERIQKAAPAVRPEASLPESRASEIVRRLLLPRLRYIENTRTSRMRAEFDAALAAELEELVRADATALAHHKVAAHLRKIPPTARPSKAAIERSKEAFGEAYRIPPGYTFVRKHERGDRSVGTVVGYVAGVRTVAVPGLELA